MLEYWNLQGIFFIGSYYVRDTYKHEYTWFNKKEYFLNNHSLAVIVEVIIDKLDLFQQLEFIQQIISTHMETESGTEGIIKISTTGPGMFFTCPVQNLLVNIKFGMEFRIVLLLIHLQ